MAALLKGYENLTMPVPDFSDFIEMACEEQTGGVYSHRPSQRDVMRTAPLLLDCVDRPLDSKCITQGELFIMAAWASVYNRYRWQSFGQWYHLRQCPYCNSELTWTQSEFANEDVEKLECRFCATCGWWDVEEHLPVRQWGETGQECW